jgi:hypothetical protein
MEEISITRASRFEERFVNYNDTLPEVVLAVEERIV